MTRSTSGDLTFRNASEVHFAAQRYLFRISLPTLLEIARFLIDKELAAL